MTSRPEVQRTTRAMKAMLWLGTLLVLTAGIQLYFFTEDTDRFFSWTIDLPLTAAFLGAFYWTSVFLASFSALQTTWANARVGLVGVQVFVWGTLVTTLLHLDKFHLDDPDPVAQGAAWLWLIVYAVDPPLLTFFYLRQLKEPGGDPVRTFPLPTWFKALLTAQAVIALSLGVLLFVAPETGASLWPWELTPLTARAIASWLLGLGLVLVSAARENEWNRLRPALGAYVVLGILQAVALLRYRGSFDLDLGGWIYIGCLALVFATGIYGILAVWRLRPREHQSHQSRTASTIAS